jgi:hypothetical protein
MEGNEVGDENFDDKEFWAMVAFHEAGHVAVALSLGLELCEKGVVLQHDPTVNSYGMAYTREQTPREFSFQPDANELQRIQKHLLVDLAGYAVQAKVQQLSEFPKKYEAAPEISYALFLCDHLYGSKAACSKFNALFQQVREILDRPAVWLFVRTLAGELSRTRSVSESRIEQIWEFAHWKCSDSST